MYVKNSATLWSLSWSVYPWWCTSRLDRHASFPSTRRTHSNPAVYVTWLSCPYNKFLLHLLQIYNDVSKQQVYIYRVSCRPWKRAREPNKEAHLYWNTPSLFVNFRSYVWFHYENSHFVEHSLTEYSGWHYPTWWMGQDYGLELRHSQAD